MCSLFPGNPLACPYDSRALALLCLWLLGAPLGLCSPIVSGADRPDSPLNYSSSSLPSRESLNSSSFSCPTEAHLLLGSRCTFAAVVVRSFHREEKRLRRWLLPTHRAFVDSRKYELVLVFDSESLADHQLVHRLSGEGHDLRFVFDPMPAMNFSALPHPFGPSGWNGRPGYTRQMRSTFYLDNFSNRTVIGLMDSDACFFSFLTDEVLLDPQGRLFLRMAHDPSQYAKDAALLGLSRGTLDAMWIDRMPIFFWRETIANVRRFLTQRYHVQTFDQAFVKLLDVGRFSPVNVLALYAAHFEPQRYHVVPHDRRTGVVSVGGNRCRPLDFAAGCCQTHAVRCSPWSQSDISHVLRYNHYRVAWWYHRRLWDDHYQRVARELRKMPDARRAAMKRACEQFRESNASRLSYNMP
eukprot:RCo036267